MSLCFRFKSMMAWFTAQLADILMAFKSKSINLSHHRSTDRGFGAV